MAVHSGSWFGLPDFGVTEKIGSLFGAPKTAQGGSNLIGAAPQQKASQTLGATTNQPWTVAGPPPGYKPTTGGGTNPAAPSTSPQLTVSNNDGDRQAAADEAARREQETRNAINSGFDDYEGRLRGLTDSYNKSQDDELTSAAKTYDSIFGGLNEQKQTNLNKLEANRGQVKQRETSSIDDLKKNLSTVMRGTQMQLGGMGASDTSASQVMAPYAYTKLAGVQEGGIRKQANQQSFEIDQQEADTNLEFSKMWKDTEVEKESRLQSVKNYYGDALRNVQLSLANAPRERQQQLANLSAGLLTEAKTRLATIEAEDRQRKKEIQDWGTNRMSALNDFRLKLANNANFNPRDITYSELQMMGANPAPQSEEQLWNPMAAAKQKRDEYFA